MRDIEGRLRAVEREIEAIQSFRVVWVLAMLALTLVLAVYPQGVDTMMEHLRLSLKTWILR